MAALVAIIHQVWYIHIFNALIPALIRNRALRKIKGDIILRRFFDSFRVWSFYETGTIFAFS